MERVVAQSPVQSWGFGLGSGDTGSFRRVDVSEPEALLADEMD